MYTKELVKLSKVGSTMDTLTPVGLLARLYSPDRLSLAYDLSNCALLLAQLVHDVWPRAP